MSLRSRIKEVYQHPSIKSVGIYTFTNFFSKAVSFLLLFVFTNPVYISPSENGLLSLFSTSILLLMPFLAMGIVHSVSADFFKLPQKEFRDFFTSGFMMPVIVMLFSVIVLFFLKGWLKESYGFPSSFIWLIPLVTFLIFCNEQLLGLIRNNNEPLQYLWANIGKTIVEFGLSFVLVVYFACRWQGRVAGIVVAYLLLFFYAIYYFKKKGYLFGSVKKQYIQSELIYAVPIIALQASIFSMNASDKFFLSHFTEDGNKTVGIYSIACIFASVINILSMALLQYFFPKIYAGLSEKIIEYRAVRKNFFTYLLVMFTGFVMVVILTPLLYRFFINEAYHPGLEYLFLLCTGTFLWAISYFFYSFLLYYKEKRKLLYLSLICIGISLSSNYFLIRSGSAFQAALANCITYSLVFVFTIFFTKKYWKQFLSKHNAA